MNPPFTISFFPCRHNLIDRNVFVDSMKSYIFHELLLLRIIRLEKRILTAIELKRWHVVPSTETAIESRCGFDPFPFQIKFYKAMIDEKIASDEVEELLCGEVITNICKPDTRGDAGSSS